MACNFFITIRGAKQNRYLSEVFPSHADVQDALRVMAKNGQVKKGDRVEITRICGTGTKRRRQTLVDCTLNNRSKKWKCRAEKTIALKGK